MWKLSGSWVRNSLTRGEERYTRFQTTRFLAGFIHERNSTLFPFAESSQMTADISFLLRSFSWWHLTIFSASFLVSESVSTLSRMK